MTDPDRSPPDVGAAVRALKPQLTRASVVALVVMMPFAVRTLVGEVEVPNPVDEVADRFKYAAITAIIGVHLMVFAHGQMRRKQEALVMPIVAQAAGLSYSKDAKSYLNGLPDRRLPH